MQQAKKKAKLVVGEEDSREEVDLLSGLPRDVLKLIVARVQAPVDRLNLICTCKRMVDAVIEVFPPWRNQGRGLVHAISHDHESYYRRWAPRAQGCWKPENGHVAVLADSGAHSFLEYVLENDHDEIDCAELFSMLEPGISPKRVSLLLKHVDPGVMNAEQSRNAWRSLTFNPETAREIADILLKHDRLDPQQGLYVSLCTPDVELVQRFLKDPRVDPMADNGRALCVAIGTFKEHGTGVAELLLSDGRVNPGADESMALVVAAREGALGLVRQLLDDRRVNAAARDSQALREAYDLGHVKICRLLLKDGRADPTAWNFLHGHSNGRPVSRNRNTIISLFLADDRVTAACRRRNEDVRINSDGFIVVVRK